MREAYREMAFLTAALIAAALIVLISLGEALITDVSEALSERVGFVMVRALTIGRLPQKPLSPAARALTAIIGAMTIGGAVIAALVLAATVM